MIERRPFGRTGHLSSVTLFGAAALARASQADADRALEVLLRHGVNHIDTAARCVPHPADTIPSTTSIPIAHVFITDTSLGRSDIRRVTSGISRPSSYWTKG